MTQKYSEIRNFYQRNGMFNQSDLTLLGDEMDANYFVLPRVLDARRWYSSRFSILGLRVINTHVICVVVNMEIWDAKKGYKVFSATSDATVASERIRENPISLEEAFERAWLGIIKELPN